MADIDITLGKRELEAALKRLGTLPDKVNNKVLGKALKAGGKPIIKSARGRIRSKSKTLARSLGSLIRKYPSGTRALIIGSRRSGKFRAFYDHLVEFGTKPHLIRPKLAGVLRVFNRFLPTISHPGSRPRPFLRPAFDAEKDTAIKVMAKKIGTEIEKLAAKK